MFLPITVPSSAVDFEYDGDLISLRHPIAYCSDSNRIAVVASLMLTRIDRRVKDGFYHEMGFRIDVLSESPPETLEIDDRSVAREFVPESSRSVVLGIVSNSYVKLIRQFEPSTIYRASSEARLPSKALAKHNFLTDVIKGEGYDILDCGISMTGRSYWLMVRSPDV